MLGVVAHRAEQVAHVGSQRDGADGASGLGLLDVVAAIRMGEGAAHDDGALVVEVAPAQRADLAAAHAGGERQLDGDRQGQRLGLAGKAQHAVALVAGEGVDGRLHALGRLAEVAGVLGEQILRLGVLQRLLEQTERLRDGLGRVAVLGGIGHPFVDHGDLEVGEPHIADVLGNVLRVAAVALDSGGLHGAAVLLVEQESVHVLLDGHVRAHGAAPELQLHDELLACALCGALGLGGYGVVGGKALAGHGVLVGEDHLPFIGVPATSQTSARVLHFSSNRTFSTEIVNQHCNQQCHQQPPNKRALENLNKGIN